MESLSWQMTVFVIWQKTAKKIIVASGPVTVGNCQSDLYIWMVYVFNNIALIICGIVLLLMLKTVGWGLFWMGYSESSKISPRGFPEWIEHFITATYVFVSPSCLNMPLIWVLQMNRLFTESLCSDCHRHKKMFHHFWPDSKNDWVGPWLACISMHYDRW